MFEMARSTGGAYPRFPLRPRGRSEKQRKRISAWRAGHNLCQDSLAVPGDPAHNVDAGQPPGSSLRQRSPARETGRRSHEQRGRSRFIVPIRRTLRGSQRVYPEERQRRRTPTACVARQGASQKAGVGENAGSAARSGGARGVERTFWGILTAGFSAASGLRPARRSASLCSSALRPQNRNAPVLPSRSPCIARFDTLLSHPTPTKSRDPACHRKRFRRSTGISPSLFPFPNRMESRP